MNKGKNEIFSDDGFSTVHMEYDEGDDELFFIKAEQWGSFMFDVEKKKKIKGFIKALRAMENAKGEEVPVYHPINVGVTFYPSLAKKIREWLEDEMRGR